MHKDTSENIAYAMKVLGLSVSDIAEKIRISETSIRNWINGSVTLRPKNHSALCRLFGVNNLDIDHSQFRKILLERKVPYFEELALLDTEKFREKARNLTISAKKFVRYTSLCNHISVDKNYNNLPIELRDKVIIDKIENKEISFWGVFVFQSLEQVNEIRSLVNRLPKSHFRIKYFPRADINIPIMNMRSYDDEVFIVGGFQDRENERDQELALLFKNNPALERLYLQYWQSIYGAGVELNRGENSESQQRLLSLFKR